MLRSEFVQDLQGLSGFTPESAALAAGRVMVHRLRDLAAERADFAFESNLASLSLASWLRSLQGSGYRVLLIYLWLPSVELAIARVRRRVDEGGHFVPDEVVRRRHGRGLANLRSTYLPLADAVWLFDASGMPPRLCAEGAPATLTIHEPTLLARILGAGT